MGEDDKTECVRSLTVVFVEAPTDGEWLRVFTEGLMLHERVAGYTLGPTFYESRKRRVDEAKESVLRMGVVDAALEQQRALDELHSDGVDEGGVYRVTDASVALKRAVVALKRAVRALQEVE